jgi:hypothetical protein
MEFDETGRLDDGLQEEPAPLYFPDFAKVNPFRTLSWRWDRARRLAEEGQDYSLATDDRETGCALEYLQASRSCDTHAQRQKLAEKMPEIHKAHEIHKQGGSLKWVLEAFLLTEETSETIGRRLGLPTAVVDWYEQLFFCVRDRLSARDWVVLVAIGMKFVRAEVTKEDVDLLLKWLAYAGGPLVLETYLPHLLPEEAGTLFEQKQTDPEQAQRVWRLVEALCAPADEELPPELQEMLKEIAEQEDVDPRIAALGEQVSRSLEEFEKGQAPQGPEEDSGFSEPDQSHPGWASESDEDSRENA